MEYYREKKHKITADLALRIGRIAHQYESFGLSEKESYDVTLNLCLLHTLLTQCYELMEEMNRSGRSDLGLYSPIDQVMWGLQDVVPDVDDYAGALTIAKLVKNLRHAMCHPTDFDPVAGTPSTGYTTQPDESGILKKVTFCNSINVTRSSKERIESARFFMVTFTPKQLKSLVLNLANLLAQPALEKWNGKTITNIFAA